MDGVATLDTANYFESYMMEKVESSCGCIWCDLELPRTKMKRQYIHYIDFKIYVCHNINMVHYEPKS